MKTTLNNGVYDCKSEGWMLIYDHDGKVISIHEGGQSTCLAINATIEDFDTEDELNARVVDLDLTLPEPI